MHKGIVFLGAALLAFSAASAAAETTPLEKALKSLAVKQRQARTQADAVGNSSLASLGAGLPAPDAGLPPGSHPAVALPEPLAAAAPVTGTATAGTIPVDPLGLTATASAEDIVISWINTPPASAQFRILKAKDQPPLADWTLVPAPASSYRDLTVTPETTYVYQVISLDAKGNTLADSRIIQTALLPSLPPGIPPELSAAEEEERVYLKWKPPAPTSHAVAGYTVFRTPEQGGPEAIANSILVPRTEFYDDRGAIGEKYCYRVAAVDAWGQTGEASTTVTAWARPRSREAMVLMSTAYRGLGRTNSGLNADLQFTYFIGTLYGELAPSLFDEQAARAVYLDPISLWLLTADAKYCLDLEKNWPASIAFGGKGSLLLFAGDTGGKFEFSSKSTFQTLWGVYATLSRSFGNWGVHGGYMLGPQGNALYYLSKYLEPESSRQAVYLGVDFPIVRRMNAAVEIIYPMNENFQSQQHPFLINTHIDRLFNFDVSYLHWDNGWAFLGYFNLRFNVFSGGDK